MNKFQMLFGINLDVQWMDLGSGPEQDNSAQLEGLRREMS